MLLADDELEAQYAEWLMANAELRICNGDDLIFHLERQTRFDEFMGYKERLDGLSQ